MKKIINSLLIAFAMYSKIPTPQADWEKENMRYVMCCFPLVGAVIGALIYGWSYAAVRFGLSEGLRAAGYVLIPVFITGGIHLDGFLDTCDALHSYAPVERKLEILKDPHTGAFAIICACSLFAADFGLWSQVSVHGARALSFGFVMSRCLSGWSVAVFPCAKNTGLAATFHDAAHRRTVGILCGLELAAALTLGCLLAPRETICMALASGICVLWYGVMARRQFGGITGDLAGWFLQMCECLMALFVVIGELL